MTTEQYQKRIQFLEYIKNNYVPENKNTYLIFYFENYDVNTLHVVIKKKNESEGNYFYSRCNTSDGAILIGYFEDYLRLDFQDKYLNITENLTTKSVLMSDLVEPFDFNKIKKELQELLSLSKTK
jgi:hypothetical protein